jgi:hypothetical protein
MDLKEIIKSTLRQHLNEQETINKHFNNNFWKWFGESKIKENNKPLICYHGTSNKNIKVFDINKIGQTTGNYGHYGYGFYFSEDIREAKTYGSKIYQCYLKIINPFKGTDKEILKLKKKGVDTIDDLIVVSIDFDSFKNSFKNDTPIFKIIDSIEKHGDAWDLILDFKNKNLLDSDKLNSVLDVLEFTTFNKNVRGVPDYIFDELKSLGIKPKLNKGFPYYQSLHWVTDLGDRSKEITDIIKQMGYDGVWYGSEIVVFEPNQIKSINNDGTWDINDNNIYS